VKESLLVNTLGHAAGVLIFAIFIFLFIQDRSALRLKGGIKALLAAGLALAWNLTSLIVLGMDESAGALTQITVAVSFSVLSLLPAVLFDLSLSDMRPESRRKLLVVAGYALSSVSIVLHASELASTHEGLHRAGLTLITIGFGLLTVIAALGVRGITTPRLVGTMSLFLLAMSFVHLGSGHSQQIWAQELAFHHAAIPLALLVLLQDYRFVLVDAFLRFLANVLLAALFVSAIAAAWNVGWLPRGGSASDQAILIAGAAALLILFAVVRGWLQQLLTHVVFRRPKDAALLSAIKVPVTSEDAYLLEAARGLGRLMGAGASIVHEPPVIAAGVEATFPIRVPPGPPRHLVLGRRSGGRRYLSEDLQALTRAASSMVEQVENFRELEMRRLMAQAELRALHSQIHPHFLFNALNALYGIIPREAKGARDTVLNLADLFRYFLETKKTHVTLEEELRIVRAYLQIENLRLGAKLESVFEIEPEALAVFIPILTVQPLVENAVKHAIAPSPGSGRIFLTARIAESDTLTVMVQDTGPGFAPSRRSGVGLQNVSRRLELSYGAGARLDIESDSSGSKVSLVVPATAAVEAVR
jgi:two-component system, LytTR family, sensor kinase